MNKPIISDAEFDCRVYKLNWMRPQNKIFIDAARLVLVKGMYATKAAKEYHVHPVSVRRRCNGIANAQLTDSRPTYYVYSSSRQHCFGDRRTIKGAQHLLTCSLIIKEWIKRPSSFGRILYPITSDVTIYISKPDGTFRRIDEDC